MPVIDYYSKCSSVVKSAIYKHFDQQLEERGNEILISFPEDFPFFMSFSIIYRSSKHNPITVIVLLSKRLQTLKRLTLNCSLSFLFSDFPFLGPIGPLGVMQI